MNLIRCHIENFGKLSDFTWDFKPDLNQLCRENGWGKSTLAQFIKVMFYGFENEGKRDELENERKRYRPWQGGVYGGNIAFSVEGRSYLAERTFGNKAAEDVFVLRSLDTNKECSDFSEKLGEEIFRIDSKSFARTIYISQNDCESVVTDSIHAKMGNLVDATDDINNYDTVIAEFKKTLNEMTPTRKTGSLYKLKEEIAEKNNKLRSRTDIEESASKIYELKSERKEKYEEYAAKLRELSERQKKLGEYMDKAAAKQEYERILREYEERKEAFEEESEYFADGVPDEQEIEQCIEKNIAFNAAENTADNYQLTASEKNALSCYMDRFGDDVPDLGKIEEMYRIAAELKELEAQQLRSRMTDEEEKSYEDYKKIFDKIVNLDEERISAYIRDWNTYQEEKAELKTKQNYAFTMQQIASQKEESRREEIRKKKKTASGMTAVLLIVFAVCIVMAVFIQPYRTAAFAAVTVSAVLLLCSIIYGIKLKSEEKNPENSMMADKKLQDDIKEIEIIIDSKKASVTEFLERMEIPYNEATVEEKLYDLKIKYTDYKKLAAKADDAKRLDKSAEIAECAGSLQEFMQRYMPDDMSGKENAEASLRRLENSVKEYKQLEEKNEKFKEAKDKGEGLKAEIDAFLEQYGFNKESEGDNLLTIKDKLQSYIHSRTEYGRSGFAKSAFERENDVEQLVVLVNPEEDATQEQLAEMAEKIRSDMEQCHKSILEYTGQLEELEERQQELDELAAELETDREKFEEDKKTYELISATMDMMEEAKTSFTARYVAPLKTAFEKYYSMISKADDREYHIDADSNVTIYEAGMQREGRFLSRGFKDLTGICMRMALIQAMYTEEKPFIIFDDPFVNLDEERTDGGLRFLHEIEKEYQVIYLTCHPAREVR